MYGDLVSTVGTQLAGVTTVTFQPPIPQVEVDTFPLGTAKALHSLTYMLEQVVFNAPSASSVGPSSRSR